MLTSIFLRHNFWLLLNLKSAEFCLLNNKEQRVLKKKIIKYNLSMRFQTSSSFVSEKPVFFYQLLC